MSVIGGAQVASLAISVLLCFTFVGIDFEGLGCARCKQSFLKLSSQNEQQEALRQYGLIIRTQDLNITVNMYQHSRVNFRLLYKIEIFSTQMSHQLFK